MPNIKWMPVCNHQTRDDSSKIWFAIFWFSERPDFSVVSSQKEFPQNCLISRLLLFSRTSPQFEIQAHSFLGQSAPGTYRQYNICRLLVQKCKSFYCLINQAVWHRRNFGNENVSLQYKNWTFQIVVSDS